MTFEYNFEHQQRNSKTSMACESQPLELKNRFHFIHFPIASLCCQDDD